MNDLRAKLKRFLAGARKHIWALLGLVAVALTLWHPAFRQTEPQAIPEPPAASAPAEPARSPAPTEEPVPTAAPSPSRPPVPDPTAGPEDVSLPRFVDVDDWRLRLVRYEYPLGEDFVPDSLATVDGREQVDSRVAPALENLIADARAAGYGVYVCSGYRDYATQHYIYFDNHVDVYMAQGMSEEEANDKARLAVQYPGCSEHQSGLAADVLEYSGQPMEPYIGGSGLMQWLEENCAEYGFVIRYPDGKTDITGVEYEPWHLRYVGVQAARYMMEHGLCQEEFLALYGYPAPGDADAAGTGSAQ